MRAVDLPEGIKCGLFSSILATQISGLFTYEAWTEMLVSFYPVQLVYNTYLTYSSGHFTYWYIAKATLGDLIYRAVGLTMCFAWPVQRSVQQGVIAGVRVA